MTAAGLTRAQRRTLEFIRAFIAEHGISPSVREIAAGVGCALGEASRRAHRLQERGAIIMQPGRARSIALPAGRQVTLPPDLENKASELARAHGVTAEAVIIECVRDRLSLKCSDFVSRVTPSMLEPWPCPQCGEPRREKGPCLICQARQQREFRKRTPMTEEQRRKDSARSYAGVYKRAGKLVPQPCETCGTTNVEMHHDDYERPTAVRWLCRPCHLNLHRKSPDLSAAILSEPA